ncbi:MAG: phosphorylase, partial [Fibrobacteria bacterium]
LAAMVAPREAAENLNRLRAEGAEGAYGFYEAVDFTKVRLQEGDHATVVKSYFAHHQGMMLVALGNVLQGGRMQERFHAEPIIRAVDPLLQERMPRGVAVTRPNADEVDRPLHVETLMEPVLHRFNTPHETIPRTHILSNGRYTVLLSAAGSGFSRWQNLAVTRWREDAVLDAYGQYFYLRDVDTGETWSAGYQPLCVEADDYEAMFAEDRVEITRRDGQISTTLEIVISPEDDAEVRRVTLENLGDRDREIEITSYCEVVMAPHESDVAHPAFSNLFVQTEFIPGLGALLATRRARASTETHSWAAHVSGVEGGAVGVIQYETDRARFLGRGRTVRRPVSVVDGKPLSNTTGAVLDPVFSLRRRVKVPGNGKIRITFATLAAQTREQALALSDKYREPESFERVATLAWTQAQIQLRHLGIGPDEARMYQRLANRLFFPDPALRPSPDLQALNRKGQDALWAYGISGDLPIIFASFDEAGDRNLARDLLKAHSYWEMKRLDVDLVLVNENPSESYLQPQQDELEGLLRMRRTDQETRGGVFLLRKDRIPSEDRVLMLATARAVLVGRRGSLADQTMRMRRATVHVAPPSTRREPAPERHAPPLRPQLEFFNGLGGFGAEGKEYHIILGEGQWTPAPWVNVIANPHFGFIASEAGSGFTWAGNSRERKLTPWSNDPVGDPPGEAAYIRDRDTGSVWTPTALPIREAGRPYVAVHGQGYTRFLHSSHGIRLELLQWVPWDDPVKLSRLTIENLSPQTRHLDVTFYAEWVLGPARGISTQHVQTFVDRGTGALFARNAWVAEFASQVAFADLEGRQDSFTCDRSEFLGRNGDRARPSALARGGPLSNRSGAGLDPCAALQSILELPPGGRMQLVFTLGQAADETSATALVKKYRGADFEASWRAVQKRWDGLLDGVQIKTPDRSLDLLLNRWLPYQILTCRLWARSGFYQAGGAFGFRDQLQDVMALALLDPALAREQILRASARQFPPGDVQHWWHPPSGRGVRTRFTDDRVWLPYAVLHYLDVTNDSALLEEHTTWLEGPEVPEGREDSYFQPKTSGETATVYEHCARALDRSLELGAHGLPLFGSGDWNDGMNRVGHEGKGESGWLAWFLIPNLKSFATLAEARGDAGRARLWRDRAERIREAMENQAWDGDWYRRGYFDDGSPLGSSASQECRIDSLAQTWAVLSGAADPARARQAMFSVEEYLVRRADGLILLFTPPFDKSASDPGYIKGYLPGVRENGGQYTHASAWVVAAFAALGEGDKAAEFFSLLNPVNHASTRAGVYRYKVEPYAAAADVYAVSPHIGRGGWTWYTGSAGWLYRTGLEWMLGLRLADGRLRLQPCIPRDWSGFEISYRRGSATYEIAVFNPNGYTGGIASLEIDGVQMASVPDTLALDDDGKTHRIKVTLGPPPNAFHA